MATSLEKRIKALEDAQGALLEPSLPLLIQASQGDMRAVKALSFCKPESRLFRLMSIALMSDERPIKPEPMLAPLSEFVH